MSKDYRHCVFCQYRFQGENVKIQSNLENNSLTSRFQTFQHSQVNYARIIILHHIEIVRDNYYSARESPE